MIGKRSGSITNNSLASGISIKAFTGPPKTLNAALNATMNLPPQRKMLQE